MATKNPIDEQLKQQEEVGNSIVDDYSKDMEAVVNEIDTGRTEAIDAINQTEKAQKDALQAETDFTIRGIEQQKSEAKDDYYEERKAAYGDYQRQVNPYGVNAEGMAANGLQNSGYAESSQVAMYNQYQQRITAARESYVKLDQEFNNQINAAKLANSSALAEIAAKAAVERAALIVEFATKKTDLLTTIAQNKAAIRQQNKSDWLSLYNSLMNVGGFDLNNEQPEDVYKTTSKNSVPKQKQAILDDLVKPVDDTAYQQAVAYLDQLDSIEAIEEELIRAYKANQLTTAEYSSLRSRYGLASGYYQPKVDEKTTTKTTTDDYTKIKDELSKISHRGRKETELDYYYINGLLTSDEYLALRKEFGFKGNGIA